MIKFNGQDLSDIKYNGQSIKRVMKDGVQIWPNAEPLQIPTGITLVEVFDGDLQIPTGITLLEIFEGVPNIPTGIQLSEYEIEPAFTYLLDDYPGASAAYSLRKLRTGAEFAVEVRRDGASPATTNVLLYDDPSKSIDLDSITESGGQTLGEWVGGASAYIFNWYDQSGNPHNLINTNDDVSQPRLISNGVLDTENLLTCMVWNHDLITFLNNTTLAGTDTFAFFLVAKSIRSSSGNLIDSASTNGNMLQWQASNTISLRRSANIVSTEEIEKEQKLFAGQFRESANDTLYVNDALVADGEAGYLEYSGLTLGKNRTTTGNLVSGSYQELILYNTDKEADRQSIQSRINDNYNIWVVTAEVDAQLIQADNDNVSDTVIEINGVRSSASDTAVANLISRNNTVITK